MATLYTCLFCGRDTTLTSADHKHAQYTFFPDDSYGGVEVLIAVMRCPSPFCCNVSLMVEWQGQGSRSGSNAQRMAEVQKFAPGFVAVPKVRRTLLPRVSSTEVPPATPEPIRADYYEAAAIISDSPKASATLARRCLQGMIRDYWKVTRPTLNQEIEAIRDKVTLEDWEAIDAVRAIGNIGAHMEKDVDVIIPVEPHEAEALLGLLRILMKDWYQARADRQARLAQVKQIGAEKAAAKAAGKASPPKQEP